MGNFYILNFLVVVMERKDILMICVGLVMAAALIWAGIFLMPDTEPSHTSAITAESKLIEDPNQINGLDVSADDYRVYITYTPEPGAKTMRVEYIKKGAYGYYTGFSAPFDFVITDKNAPIAATFQRGGDDGFGSKMRVTIIYDNNVIKFIEFST